MNALALVLSKLQNVRRTRDGVVGLCPNHPDRNPSLAVTEGRDGRVLLYCRARCRTEDVVAAFGLRLGDLFPTSVPQPARSRARSALAAARAEALALGRRQAWAREGVVERYEAADAIRAADRLRSLYRTATDDEAVWDRLAVAAALTSDAENVLA